MKKRQFAGTGLVALMLAAGPVQGAQTRLDVGLGYRVDDFDWNIAGDITGANPNILSELTWENVESLQLEVGGEIESAAGWLVSGSAAYGGILDGRNQDSDYLGDDRTLEFSRSHQDAKGKDTLDLEASLGYRLSWHDPEVGRDLHFIPRVGYSHHEMDLRLTNGFQVIPATGPINGLDSRYEAEWKGPWLGLDLRAELSARTEVFLNLSYHWLDYQGVADWNLRTDFAHPKSFEHETDGNAGRFSLGFSRQPAGRRWSWEMRLDYQKWNMDPGVDRTFFATGAVAETRLNQVRWRQVGLSGALRWRF